MKWYAGLWKLVRHACEAIFVLTALKISKTGCSSISLFTSIEIQAVKNGEITIQF